MTAKGEQILVIYTKNYPFGTGEAFLHNEVQFLSREFHQVIVVPMFVGQDSQPRPLPDNVKISVPQKNPVYKHKLIFSVLALMVGERTLFKHLRHFRYAFSYFYNTLCFEKAVVEIHKNYPQALHYTYWFEEWALLLSALKRKKIIHRFISRAHGYDLYEKRWVQGFIPFRNFELKQVDKLVFASNDACEQLKKDRPAFVQKYVVSKIGTYDHGLGPLPVDETFVLVSCSNLLPIKRVDKIAAALAQLNFPVHWIHFGDGAMKTSVQEQAAALPSSVQVTFKGNVDNKTLMQFYTTTGADAMILLSETEGGVPVSLQEAASFGIPLIGAHAGGIPEIVNHDTGILVSLEAHASEVAAAITVLHEKGKSREPAYRNQVRHYWKQHYSATENFARLPDLLRS